MDNGIAVTLKNIHKSFKLPHERHNGIKQLVLNFYKRRRFEQQHVLRGISFDIKKGEFFGIVGRNGSGKSTLLKLLAGIYVPEKGDIHVDGTLTPFIELGVGFNPELTGRENVFLNGALLGFSHKEMQAMYGGIVEFAELEQFMDQKLKNYSSGMQVRLAFSIAIRAQSDILLIDEVLAVGDAAFQQKCFEVFADLKQKGTTIILVTHDMNSVLRFCDRAVLIDRGKIIHSGKASVVADEYLELNYEQQERIEEPGTNKPARTAPRITGVQLLDENDNPEHKFKQKEKLKLVIEYTNTQQLETHFGAQIFNEAGVYCFGTNTKHSGERPTKKKKGKVIVEITTILAPGTYYVTVASMDVTANSVFDYRPKVAEFRMVKDTQLEGIAILQHKWERTDD